MDEDADNIGLLDDSVLSNQVRFTIMLVLYVHQKIGFTELQKLLGLTPGNLDHHINRLEKENYVETHHVLSWRPLKIVKITEHGRDRFYRYAKNLKDLLRLVT